MWVMQYGTESKQLWYAMWYALLLTAIPISSKEDLQFRDCREWKLEPRWP